MVETVYHDDGSTTMYVVSPLFDEPKIIRHSEFENWCIDQIVRDYKPHPPLRPHEIAEIFPESKTYINTRKKEINVLLGELLEDDRKINATMTALKQREEKAHLLEMNKIRREKLLDEQQRLETIRSFMGKKSSKAIQDFQLALERAKAYPMENLLEIKRRKAVCPWHNDTDPSLYYYPKQNRVHCFVCDKGGDTIDVVQVLQNCTIKEAINWLNNH